MSLNHIRIGSIRRFTSLNHRGHSGSKASSKTPIPAAEAASQSKSTSSKNAQSHVAPINSIKLDLDPEALRLQCSEPRSEDIAVLRHGLDRVLFNPGVHFLKDPRTKTFNFDRHLEKVTQPEDFNFNHVPLFIPASLDKSLHERAEEVGAKFCSSTSSMTPTMSLLYFLLSRGKDLDLTCLSEEFQRESRNFTYLSRSPMSVMIRPHGERVRSILVEKLDHESVLSKLGHTLERFLTETPEDYGKMLKNNSNGGVIGNEFKETPYYHTLAGNILLRSQIDCHNPNLPRRTFDLKTRATLPIRMDVYNYKNYLDYKLERQHGLVGSFEREFYDMCRSAFLKYNFQVRIGGMDGIFVAYHNTAELFGFQYLPRETLDQLLFGGSVHGDYVYAFVLQMYNAILQFVLDGLDPQSTNRLTFALSKDCGKLHLFLETWPMGTWTRPPTGTLTPPLYESFRQFIVSTRCTVNGGIRREPLVTLEDRGDLKTPIVHLSIQEVAPKRLEFEPAWSKTSEARLAPMTSDDVPLSFMKQIHTKRK